MGRNSLIKCLTHESLYAIILQQSEKEKDDKQNFKYIVK